MKRLTTLALLAGMLSAPALHSEEPGSGAAAPLSFPQLNDAADSEPGDEPPAASPEEGASPAAPATAGDAAATAPAPVMPDLPPPVSGTAAPEVIPVAPVWGGDLNLAQMGMPDGIILSGGQRQGGVSFTLPADQVVIHSQLSLAVRVSPEMASRNATLQLMLNGQPLGTLPLGADGEDVSHYQLDIPPALMVSSNNLSVKINDGDTLQCQRDIHDTSRVTVLPTSHFSWESQQLNISDDLSHFPRPFFDSMQMTPADIAVAYGAKPSADVFSAAALISSWLGIQADYRGIAFSALRDRLPERHGIVIGHPGEQVGGMMLPETDKPLLRIIANPANPAYKLLLIVGKNDTALRMAAWRLTRGNFAPQTATLDVEPQTIPVGKAYDAPRWIPTDRPVKLSELLRKDQSPTVSGVWHEPLRIAFRAAPDLYLWDGETIPLQVGYRLLASYAAPAAVANAAPGVQPQAATPAAPIVVGEPTATLAEPTAPAAVAENVPQREVKLSFATIAPPPGSIVLRGSRPDASVEFGMRSDELVANALLNLEYTPSPSLLPVQSQLKVYLNDELMGVLPVTKEQLGKKIRAQLPIDPLYITDFNRVRLEFVGHYRDVCENPASSTLWLDVGRESYLDLTYQSLKVNNDLSHFPVPFYDPRDNRPLKLPMIFPGSPAVTQQQAAAIVASWFGSKAGWRGQQFPVYFNELPDRNAIVFATNDKRPDFLRDHPPVKAPTIEMIDNPNDPYVKLLVIFGRDDNDLLLAAKGIAQGNILFRGSSVTVDGIKTLQPRQPYDAPNWVRTDRSVTFAELKTYEQQLQSSGLVPDAITVALNLPPDLYLLRANGIDMDLKYRYTMPPVKDSSRMDISLNDQFLQSFSLNSSQDVNKLILRLPVLQGLLDGKSEVTIPALRLGAVNQLRFDFQYMNPMPGGSIDNCITFQPVQNHVVIGDDSTIDFSKYYHFIALPDLRVFANAGFPYSRMADLSDTLVVVPKAPTQGQVATLLQALGGIGSQTGLAAINLQMTDDGNQIKNKDADLLLIGAIPSSLKDDTKINLLVEATKSWVKMPMRHYDLASIYPDDEARTPNTRTDITSSGPMATVIGFQSPYNDQRSVVALLADSPRGNELLTNALNDSGKRAAMFGSVAVIRESGVNSLRVGDIYYVGHLPWFERIWFALSNHPILLAIFAAISIVLLAWVLWRMLRIISRRRLSLDDE
ncbi:cellulose biosynthesis cyclic di-GMP-binding regulatory protein BcsB [Klebsiella pneumoniae]|nr:cellulose biosynthesis cyclic di-GMP-binding regulatory protein BcsB [Klebsiella pneumoniae]BDS92555.1 hypothetical protein Kpn21f22_02170 [Klebsiella pneumoniae]BDS97548.1 hypothetical protein Kpn21rf22_02170 [Klebsiella pneumoniae]